MVVNADAGTATGLSADEFDGKDSSQFAAGINGKALDSNKLDGRVAVDFMENRNFQANALFDPFPPDSTNGPLPLETTFTTNGGQLLIWASGSGFRSTQNTRTHGRIGMELRIDGSPRLWLGAYANERENHKTFVDQYTVLAPLQPGTHTLRLESVYNSRCNTTLETDEDYCTATDQNDFFDVFILEMPVTKNNVFAQGR